MKDFKDTFKPVACVLYFAWNNKNVKVKVKQSRYRPEVAQRVPGS
jgi:hypothetical protein